MLPYQHRKPDNGLMNLRMVPLRLVHLSFWIVATLVCGCTEIPPPPSSQMFAEWASEHAVPIDSLDAPLGEAELGSLQEAVGDARVVGIGESRHDTREQLLMKGIFVRHLIEDLGFRALILEESYPHAELLDRYVASGDGDIRVLMNSLAGWYLWDTEEMLDLVQWIWQINQDRPLDKRVRILGMDITAPALGIQEVLNSLEDAGVSTELNGRSLGLNLQQGDFWPGTWERYSALSDEDRTELSDNYGKLEEILNTERPKLVASLSESEYERMLLLGEIGEIGNALFSSSSREEGGEIREHGMAKTILWILEHEIPGEKAIVWSHNLHVAKSTFRMPGLAEGALTPMGFHLSQSLGNTYISVGGTFGTGSYPSSLPPGERAFEAVPIEVVDGALSEAKMPLFFLDLREAQPGSHASTWLQQDRAWRAQDSQSWLMPGKAFDLVYFVNVISRSQPTPLALQRFQSLR